MDAYDIIVEVQPGGEIHLDNLRFSRNRSWSL
jgi:hypothetical protein